ncbi:MAG: hypothetical protein AAF985_24550 [Bacteroidota bacterium]
MSPTTLTLFEDYPKKIPAYKEHRDALYQLRELIGNANFSLQEEGILTIKHYVGFFQSGATRIQVLPKVYATTAPPQLATLEAADALHFVYQLLATSQYFKIKKLPPQWQGATTTDLLELFIEIFIDEFLRQFRKSVHRNYVQQEGNQAFIKGKIMVAETLRHNPILKHLHYVRYDDYTINNPLNRIFKFLILSLLNKTNVANNKKKLIIGLSYLQQVDSIALTKEHFNQIKFNRLNNNNEALFHLAQLIYHQLKPRLHS